MTPQEYAAQFRASLIVADASRERTIQSTRGQVGISDLGWCQEYTRRLIVQAPRTDSPIHFAPIMGTYVDQGVTADRAATRDDLLFKVPLVVELPNGAKVPGTADEIDTAEPSVVDYKTKDTRGLAGVRVAHSTMQQRWQRHNYGAAAVQAGIVPEQDLIVRNVWLDRSGRDSTVHVEQEPFSWAVVAEASAWLDDVFYAVQHDEEAAKQPPRHECRDYCVFYTGCRGGEVEVGPITNPRLAQAVDLYAEAAETVRTSKAIMEALRGEVENVTGRTDRAEIVSTRVNKGAGHISVTARLL